MTRDSVASRMIKHLENRLRNNSAHLETLPDGCVYHVATVLSIAFDSLCVEFWRGIHATSRQNKLESRCANTVGCAKVKKRFQS